MPTTSLSLTVTKMSAPVAVSNHRETDYSSAVHEHQAAATADLYKGETILLSTYGPPEEEVILTSDRQFNMLPRHDQVGSTTTSEVQSPHLAPQILSKAFMPATVEDCTDEEDNKSQLTSFVASPSKQDHNCVPRSSDSARKVTNSSTYTDSLSGSTKSQHNDLPAQNHAASQSIPRRASVMDYLVTPVNTSSESTSLATESDTPHWESSDEEICTRNHIQQPKMLLSPQMDNRSQISWTTAPQGNRVQPSPMSMPMPIPNNYAATPYQPAYNHSYTQLHATAPNPPPIPPSVILSEQRMRYGYGSGPLDSPQMAPLSGYGLLAAKLAADSGDTSIKPIYRRFEALNHRILLYLQDDISQLEGQLADMEAQDAAERSYSGATLTASRRQERWVNPAFLQQKMDILGSIGFKLEQYSQFAPIPTCFSVSASTQMCELITVVDQVLTSFRGVQGISAPSWRDIQAYKDYLFASKPIVDDEIRFLDFSTDLLCLSPDHATAADASTPMPREPEDPRQFPSSETKDLVFLDATVVRLVVLGIWAAILPLVLFAFVPTYFGRMTVLACLCASITMAVESGGVKPECRRGKLSLIYCVLYFGSMAVIAHTCS